MAVYTSCFYFKLMIGNNDMPTTVEITCINKFDRHNPYERITHVGGGFGPNRWRFDLDEAIDAIKTGQYKFYVEVEGEHVWVEIATSPHGNDYLKTEADDNEPNNLLSLPECP